MQESVGFSGLFVLGRLNNGCRIPYWQDRVNVLPSLSLDSTASPAPILFANSYTIDRPSPVPRRAEKALVVKKGSKMRVKFSGAMPQPKSRTEMDT